MTYRFVCLFFLSQSLLYSLTSNFSGSMRKNCLVELSLHQKHASVFSVAYYMLRAWKWKSTQVNCDLKTSVSCWFYFRFARFYPPHHFQYFPRESGFVQLTLASKLRIVWEESFPGFLKISCQQKIKHHTLRLIYCSYATMYLHIDVQHKCLDKHT